MICRVHVPLYIKNWKYERWLLLERNDCFSCWLTESWLNKTGRELARVISKEGKLCGIKIDDSYMFFVLPKSKHGSYRLSALWLPQDQNPRTFQILLHSCLSFPHRMTVWLPSHLSIHCLQALPHSKACIICIWVAPTLFLPQVIQCPLSPFPSEWPPRVSSLSSCSPSLSQTYLNTLDINWEHWDILNDFINLFSQR